MYLCHSENLMPKDTKSLGNNKAPACESWGLLVLKKEGAHFDTPPFLSRILKLILVVNSFFFDSSFLTGKSTQVIQFSATNFTYLVHLDAVDSR